MHMSISFFLLNNSKLNNSFLTSFSIIGMNAKLLKLFFSLSDFLKFYIYSLKFFFYFLLGYFDVAYNKIRFINIFYSKFFNYFQPNIVTILCINFR